MAPAEEACRDWEELRQARYVYKNNVWNKGTITDYEQCVMRRVVDGEDQYGWRWRWPYQGPSVAALSPDANYHQPGHEVRAYPEVVHGKGPWDTLSTMSNLPLRVSEVRQIRVDYESYLAAEGDYNLAFSMWLTSDTPGTPEGVSHEIMIWVDRTDWAPGGPEDHVAEVEIDGSEYALFVRQNANDPDAHASLVGQKYIAFAKYTDQFSGTLNLEKFLEYLVEYGHIPGDHYVNDVELGNEVLDGSSGVFWLKSFDVQVR